MFQPEAIRGAFELFFTPEVFYWIAIGITVGIGVGAIPGLSAATAIAIMLPLTFTMPVAPALGLLIGLYKGSVYGGSISAISFATPGTSEAAATVYDGYKLMKKGQGRKAVEMALYSSVSADTASDLVLIFVAPPLAMVALKFGPAERFWLVVLAFTLIGALSGKHLAKGLISASLGVFLATIGPDPVSAVPRMTFGLWWLTGGIPFIPLMIGLFAISTMLGESITLLREKGIVAKVKTSIVEGLLKSKAGLTFREFLQCAKEIFIGFSIGSFIGFLPGLGSTVGAFLSYGVAKQASPEKKIGEGVLEGVAAAEAGNNATVGPTLIPLLAFGIPGSISAALIGAALMLQGATPSPRMFKLYPEIVYALFMILIVANGFNLGIGRIFSRLYARLGLLPKPLLVPLVFMMATIGSFAFRGNPYDVVLALIFGLVGYGMKVVGIPTAPLVISFLITPMMESNLRRALLIGHGEWIQALFGSPLSIGLVVATILLTFLSLKLKAAEMMQGGRGESEENSH
jgi:putative tricarboxylic transport membrane protein